MPRLVTEGLVRSLLWVFMPMGVGPGGPQLVEWALGEDLRFLLSYTRQPAEILGSTQRASQATLLITFFVGVVIIGFWVLLGFCLR